MATIVGTLQVDLVANTATFTADLGKCKDGLNDFAKGAEDAGQRVDFSMREARGSLMLVEGELGTHLPREMNTLLASIPGLGEAFATMLPVIGIIAAIGLITRLYEAHEKAAEEISKGWDAIDSSSSDAMAHLEDKLLSVQAKADDLAGNHLGALKLSPWRILSLNSRRPRRQPTPCWQKWTATGL
jgi:hypothetical protein